jgi:hypothetical protein
MKRGHGDVVLFVLASPILAVRGVIRFVRHLAFLRMAIQPALPCKTCGGTIDLLGMWRCGCGATMEGHLLRPCPVCHSFPAMIRCHRCGATQAVHR